MDAASVLETFLKYGAIKRGHFVYASRNEAGETMHGGEYVSKEKVIMWPGVLSDLCRPIAKHFVEELVDVDFVVAPATAGVALGQWVAHWIEDMLRRPIGALYADKVANGGFAFTRGFDLVIPGKNILAVEDVLTTGGSVSKVITAAQELGGNIVGLGALCNRGKVTKEKVGVPELFALFNLDLQTYPASECPLCKAGVPINTDLGKGLEFLREQAALGHN